MSDARDDLIGRLVACRRMPYGRARTLAAEVLVRAVEESDHPDLLPAALLDLVEAYTFGPPTAQVFATFATLLRLWDTSPELFDESDAFNLFWEFKWVADALPEHPEVTRPQAEALLADMRRRFQLAGHGLAAVERANFGWYRDLGEDDRAEEFMSAWLAQTHDKLDCASCRVGTQMSWHLAHDHPELVTAMSAPTDSSCNREPSRSHELLAWAHLRHGAVDEAVAAYARAMATLDPDLYDADSVGERFSFWALGNQWEKAVSLLEEHGGRAFSGHGSPMDQLDFCLRLVEGLAAHPARSGEVIETSVARTAGELRGWAEARAEELAARFDARAGNGHQRARLAKARQAQVLATLPLAAASPSAMPTAPSRPAPTGTLPEELSVVERAEAFVAAQQWDSAFELYAAEAMSRERGGDLAGAGLLLAECAQCRVQAEDWATAVAHFARAWDFLTAGGADPALLVEVAAAWAPVAERTGTLGDLLAALERFEEPETTAMSQDLAERQARERSLREAKMGDLRARARAGVAARAGEIQLARDGFCEAARQAQCAAELFARNGAVAQAVASFQLAGDCFDRGGDVEQACWNFESALEGAKIQRRRKLADTIVEELVRILEGAGQVERARAIVEQHLA